MQRKKRKQKEISATKQTTAHPGAHLLNYPHPDKFGNWLGYQITKFNRKQHSVVGVLEIRDEHLSSAGRVHGGVVAAFLDFTCGSAVFTTMGPDDFCSTVELKVNYLLPLELGDRIEARAHVVFRGNRLRVVLGHLYRNNSLQQAVAIVTATFNVVTGDRARARAKKNRALGKRG